MPVTLANNLLRLVDLSPALRNTNVASDDYGLKIGPHGFAWDGAQWRIYVEGIEDDAPSNDTTAPLLATASVLQGPWTLVSASRLITPDPSPSWENSELSPSSAEWDGANNRWVVWVHGGNNSPAGNRRLGVLYSTDGFVGRAFAREAGNPILSVGAPGATDDTVVADLKIQRLANGTYLGFYRGIQSGGPSTGTIHRVTGASPNALTKQGSVIGAGAGGTWRANGVTPGAFWVDPEGRVHMFAGAPETDSGHIGYFWSDDNGATWTEYGSNPVNSAGASGEVDDFTADVLQGAHDGDVFFLTAGTFSGSYATNPPLRAQMMYITPARVTTPRRRGKFYVGSTARTAITATSVLSNDVRTVLIRFRAYRLQRAAPQHRHFYAETAAFNEETYWRIEGGSGVDAGKLTGWFRTPTGFTSGLTSLAAVDDGRWHIGMARSTATNNHELWLDGVLQATSTATVGSTASATTKEIGNFPAFADPALCTISDVVTVVGTALTWAQAMQVIESRLYPSGVSAAIDWPNVTPGSDSGDVATVEAFGPNLVNPALLYPRNPIPLHRRTA